MLHLLPGSAAFAVAGLIAAGLPVLIHLLNRRRYRVVQWAAMQFLMQAVQRNRRMMQLRDLLLMLLRALAMLLLGLALARPFFSSSATSVKPNQPLHAVLLIDNSLSMAYQKLDRSLLEEAKQRGRKFIEDLPEGSVVSVLPICGSADGFSREAYRSKADAREALDRIPLVDRSANVVQALDLAAEACRKVPELPTKRVVLIGDQQRLNWPADAPQAQLKELGELQVVSVAPDDAENSWIEDFSLQDGLADVEAPAIFSVTIRHEGPSARHDVPVTLSIDGQEVATKVVDLEPGQSRELLFEYRFTTPVEPGKAVFVPAKVSLPPDHLKDDDARYLSVPVVAAMPVVFVDQWGSDEDPRRGRYGETRHLRRLLSPMQSESGKSAALVRHVKIDQLDRKLLEDARLVVIAGVPNPSAAVPLLRQFVEQGGQLVITAGADFDPGAWTQLAWLGGEGVLPMPLDPQPIGQTPELSTRGLKPFYLSFASMSHDYFHLADVAPQDLEDLYSSAIFFKAVRAELEPQAAKQLLTADTQRIEKRQAFINEAQAKLREFAAAEAQGRLTDSGRRQRDQLRQKLADVEPSWLTWAQQQPEFSPDRKPAEVAELDRPQVLARFDNGSPYLVQRRIGRGQVLLATSGALSSWNTLPKSNAIVMWYRILRQMLLQTLPQRSVSTVQQIALPVADRNALYTLSRPDGTQEALNLEALSAESYGLIVRNPSSRGVYKVSASRPDQTGQSEGTRIWETSFAVNGPGEESDLTTLDQRGLRERVGPEAHIRWVNRGDPISLEGAQVSGQNLWKWLLVCVLVALMVESLLVAWPRLTQERSA